MALILLIELRSNGVGKMFAVAFGIFLFIALSVAACRALDTLRAVKADRVPEVTSYTGPTFSRHGNEESK